MTNVYYPRLIDRYLLDWKNGRVHKPLLLRGARQVGKSRAVQHLGESFKYYIEANFEKREELKNLFQQVSDVHEIAARIALLYHTPIIPGQTLLFLDEIQACPEAIKRLWFFKEDYPELHVVAAGSLLEFALKKMPSFGVGRIRSLFMYPMSFEEFLLAQGKQGWVDAIEASSPDSPIVDELHLELVQLFRTFLIVGGMPSSVATWVETHDYLQCADEQDDIHQTYYDDFVKYADEVSPQLLRNTLRSVVAQVGGKFVFSQVDGGFGIDDVKRALELLSDAGLIKRVSHSAGNGIPLGAEVNDKFRKYNYLDSGLLLRMLDLELGGADILTEMILAGAAADLVNKGGLTEMVAGWEMVKYGSPRTQHDLFYWQNTDKGTSSEVDYLTTRQMKVLPIEVKSGISGKMKSLRLFMRKRHLTRAVRTSLENFGILNYPDAEDGDGLRQISIIPLYALSRI